MIINILNKITMKKTKLITVLFVLVTQLIFSQTLTDLLELGKSKGLSGDYKESMDLFNKAISMDSLSARAFNGRGVVKYMVDDYQGSVEDFTTAIKLSPSDGMFYCNRGISYEMLDRDTSAINDYTTSIKLSPNERGTYYNRGTLFKNRGYLNEAIIDYTMFIKLSPKKEKLHEIIVERGVMYHELKNYDKASNDFNRALKINPKYTEAYLNRGNLKYSLGDLKGSNKDYTKAIKIDSTYALAYSNRGSNYYELGDTVSAFNDFVTAVTLNPEDYESYNNIAVVLMSRDEFNGAIENLNKSILIYDQESLIIFNRARCYYNIGNIPQSLKDVRLCIELEPNNGSMHFMEGLLLDELGYSEQACEKFQKSLSLGYNEAAELLLECN